MKKIYLTFIIFLCVTLCAMAAQRDKSRDKSNEPSAVTASTVTPLSQQKAAPKEAAQKNSALLNTAAKDTISQRSASSEPSRAETTVALGQDFIRPGEAIRIYAFPDTGSFVNGFYPVDGHGCIYLPIIGKMNVMGMSEKAFLDTLKTQYINYLRYPNLQIRHSIRISLLGGFQRPGLFYIDPDYSIWDAVYLAGGTTREDGLKRMKWERDRIPVVDDIIPYYQSGQSLRSVGFQSGDQLWTPVDPKRSWWEIAIRDIMLSQIFPIITTSASLYVSYVMYQTYKNR